ncbi:MAG: alcohol dehydrogenase [Bermanella sp.]|jgi:alcohol dehydrogenase
MNTQVWYTPKAGAISRLTQCTQPLDDLAHNEVRVAVKSIGLNFADIFAITGLYSATPQGSFTPGLEYSGEVIASRSPQYKVGDKVMGVTRFGGYSTVINTQDNYLTPLPEGWSHQQGAAYLVQTLTAYYALTELGNIKPNQTVLIHSAAGGVGLQAMKLVQSLGAKPVGTVSSHKKADYLKSLGFETIMVREPNFKKQLQQSQYTFDLVLDGVGGAVQKASFHALNPMGRLVVFGAAEFTPGKNRPNYVSAVFKYLKRPKYDVMDMISDNKSVMAFNLIWLWEQVDYLTQLIQDMQTIKITPPHVGHEFDFNDAKVAIECLRQGDSIGKVVLNVTD